jgi:tRNA1Val (adenine37-N6)-methyltransferase
MTDLVPGPEETLDELLRGRIKVLQPRRGARVSLDALLLADFARADDTRLGSVLDLGCGGGVIGLALAVADPTAQVTGVEIQPDMAAIARRNARLNGAGERVKIIQGDLTRPRDLPLEPGTFDLVVSNPPFHSGEGRVSRDPARALARQELACTVDDIAAVAHRFVRPRGRASFVFPADRLADLLVALSLASLRPRLVRAVHSVANEPARRILVEAMRDYRGGVTVCPPLVVHGNDRRSYTPEGARILGEVPDLEG